MIIDQVDEVEQQDPPTKHKIKQNLILRLKNYFKSSLNLIMI